MWLAETGKMAVSVVSGGAKQACEMLMARSKISEYSTRRGAILAPECRGDNRG